MEAPKDVYVMIKYIKENKRKCTNEDLTKKCSIIGAKSSINYTKINSKYICVKRTGKKYIDYIKESQLSKGSFCPKDYQDCGIINDLERTLCLKTIENCPIKINDTNNNNNLDENFPFNYNSHYLKDIKEKQILGVLKLNQYIPCIYPGEKNWSKNYELESSNDKCTKKINNKLNDNRYQELSKFKSTKYQLYKDNNIMDGLPYYDEEKIKNENIYLYGRNLMGFNQEKIKDFSFEKFFSLQKSSNRSVFISKILSYIFFGEIGFVILSQITNCICSKRGPLDPGYIERLLCLGVFYIVIHSLLIIVQGITNIVILVYTFKVRNYINIKENDEFTNDLFDILIGYTTKNLILSIIINILFFFLFLFGIYVLCNIKRLT